jgi:hypothetical protein
MQFDCEYKNGMPIKKLEVVKLVKTTLEKNDQGIPKIQYWDMRGNLVFELETRIERVD